jgi:glycosyltransferase involved in cell wall biosynthesis
MRIGFDASVVRGNRTGVEYYSLRLLEALLEVEGVEVVAFSDHEIPEIPDTVVRTSRLPLVLWRQLVLPNLVKQSGCTSVHSPVTALALRLRVPVVATVHDLTWKVLPECYSPRVKFVQGFWLRRACSRAARVVCVSDTTRLDLVAHLPAAERKAVTVHSGAVAAGLSAVDEQAVGHATGKFGIASRFVLVVGRLERRKNPVHILRAFAKATEPADLADVSLVFAGAPDNAADETEAAAHELGIAKRVVLCSYVKDDLAALYQAADVFVYASLYEGFGHPPFEAISLGTPIIASNIPVIREVLGDGGELVPPTDVDALAAAMRRVLTDRAFAADLLRRGRARLRHFSWRATAEAIAELHRAWA